MGAAEVPQGDAIHVELDPASMLGAYTSHRCRFADEARALDAETLAMPSRCGEWTVADVLRHLCDVDSWLERIWAGEMPPFEVFDPLATPNELAGAHLVAGDGPPRVAPTATGVGSGGAAAGVIDALTGRGALEEVLPDSDAMLIDQLSGLARYVRS